MAKRSSFTSCRSGSGASAGLTRSLGLPGSIRSETRKVPQEALDVRPAEVEFDLGDHRLKDTNRIGRSVLTPDARPVSVRRWSRELR
jgi:hypothetical protein